MRMVLVMAVTTVMTTYTIVVLVSLFIAVRSGEVGEDDCSLSLLDR